MLLLGQREEARQAASSALRVAQNSGGRMGEASALVVCANAYVLLGKAAMAKESASKALLLFQELNDLIGEEQAKAAIDAIENPVDVSQLEQAAAGGRAIAVRRQKSVDPQYFKDKVRSVVAEIVGMDGLMEDTPLMQSGLTSQSAVLLRNSLTQELPGTSLPFTLMFDYPSIADLSSFFVERAGPEEEEEIEWVYEMQAGEVAVAPQAQGPSPEELKKQVRGVVAEIVGMDDLVDDTPLMQSGLTSQSAVLLRNALSKELPGASLPFTMMFDYPSIQALTDFFVERTVP